MSDDEKTDLSDLDTFVGAWPPQGDTIELYADDQIVYRRTFVDRLRRAAKRRLELCARDIVRVLGS